MTVARTAAGTPMPKTRTAGSRYAKAGSTCMVSSTGRRTRCMRSERPAASPRRPPSSTEAATATTIRASVCMVGTHMPSTPQTAKAAREVSASRTPATRQATSVAAAVTPAQPRASSTRYTARTETTTALLTCPRK
ncbi:hypothetical protein GCM10020254_17950 [Streptomyces goshikiensis]